MKLFETYYVMALILVTDVVFAGNIQNNSSLREMPLFIIVTVACIPLVMHWALKNKKN